ncbi:hypothetical protein [Xanthomonas arboricola]|uniref:hypothetical protein n=1 Tax=Xanthomonas arboricola TaxID=56448 RepID=UPI001E5D913F|nr:hypothetical protein [Xanthomonas arboricola]
MIDRFAVHVIPLSEVSEEGIHWKVLWRIDDMKQSNKTLKGDTLTEVFSTATLAAKAGRHVAMQQLDLLIGRAAQSFEHAHFNPECDQDWRRGVWAGGSYGQSTEPACSKLRMNPIPDRRALTFRFVLKIQLSAVDSSEGLSRQISIPASLERLGSHSSGAGRKRAITSISDDGGIPFSRSIDAIIELPQHPSCQKISHKPRRTS